MTAAFDERIVRVALEIDGETQIYDQLNITARGTKYRSALMSQCEIRLFNLTREHQQYILTKASPAARPPAPLTPINITLDVGRKSYGQFRLFEGACFAGGVTQPPDMGIVLQSLTNNFAMANFVTSSLPVTATLYQVASLIARQMNLTLLLKSTNPGKLIGNYSHTGSPQKQMKKLNEMGVVAHIDGKVLVVVDPEQPRDINTTVQVNAQTGMVGIPQPTTDGCLVRVMVNQAIDIGGKIQVTSEENPSVNGEYIVMQLDFEVANREDPFWYTLMCKNIKLFIGTQ